VVRPWVHPKHLKERRKRKKVTMIILSGLWQLREAWLQTLASAVLLKCLLGPSTAIMVALTGTATFSRCPTEKDPRRTPGGHFHRE
jgi:hypothetical protein